MSAIEETKREISVPKAAVKPAPSPSFVTRTLDLLSSVRFGVTNDGEGAGFTAAFGTLISLLVSSIADMIIENLCA